MVELEALLGAFALQGQKEIKKQEKEEKGDKTVEEIIEEDPLKFLSELGGL